MSEFFASIPAWVFSGPAITLVLIILFFSLLMFFLSWKTGKSFSLSLGPFKLVLGGKKKEVSDTFVQNVRDSIVDSVRVLVDEKSEKIYRIKNVDTINKQLKFADEKIIEIKSAVINRFAKMLQDKLPPEDNAKTHKEYRSYQIMIGLLANDLKEKILKTSLIENHIIDYTELEWESYISQKAELMVTMACDFIDVMYDANYKAVSLKELSIGNQDIIQTVKEMIKVIYRRARSISLENQETIEELKKELTEDLNKLKGLHENKKASMD